MSARSEVGDSSCENEVSSDLNVYFEPSAGSRNQGCVLFVFGSQRGDAPTEDVPIKDIGTSRGKQSSRRYAEILTLFSAILCGLGVSAIKTTILFL